MNDKRDYWSDYWKNDGQNGEVYVNSKGDKPAYVIDYWRHHLADIERGSKLIDLACGAGSIYENLSQETLNQLNLHATDVAPEALALISKRLPNVHARLCSTADMPFENHSFNAVLSQFGVEYAGIEAFSEAARLVAQGGFLCVLSHYKEGYIDQRNKTFLDGAELAISSGFIDHALALTKATYAGASLQLERARIDFMKAEKMLSDSLKDHPEGIHQHLYFGFKQLYTKHQSYYQSDITNWLEAMKKDINKSIVKVSEIRKVSLSSEQIERVRTLMSEQGLSNISIEPVMIPESQDVFAWSISAARV